jgi:hypothetical protein
VKRGMRVVAPYRPFAAESDAHKLLGAFDWVDALRMQQASVKRACKCEAVAISDVATPLPVPAKYYETRETRLMLWILEVSLRYLESNDFDRDTAMVSPDMLVFDDLRPYFRADLGVLVRSGEKYASRALLNGVQFWRHDARSRLVDFYAKALEMARALPESVITWGADTAPIVDLLSPLELGLSDRGGLRVECLDAYLLMSPLSGTAIDKLEKGIQIPRPATPLVDFRYLRKLHMRAYFDATIGATA